MYIESNWMLSDTFLGFHVMLCDGDVMHCRSGHCEEVGVVSGLQRAGIRSRCRCFGISKSIHRVHLMLAVPTTGHLVEPSHPTFLYLDQAKHPKPARRQSLGNAILHAHAKSVTILDSSAQSSSVTSVMFGSPRLASWCLSCADG